MYVGIATHGKVSRLQISRSCIVRAFPHFSDAQNEILAPRSTYVHSKSRLLILTGLGGLEIAHAEERNTTRGTELSPSVNSCALFPRPDG